jgi:nucleoid-associated protein Lsr2
MTKKIHVHLIDDLDASEASETLRFEVDGRPYEIDLSSRNAQKFRAEIAPYIRHARRVATHVRRRGRAGSGPGRPHAGAQAAAPAVAGLAAPGPGEGGPSRADSAAGRMPGQEFGNGEHASP